MKTPILLAVSACAFMAACAPTGSLEGQTLSREEAAYSTVYLGRDGTVFEDPRAATARKKAKENRKKTPAAAPLPRSFWEGNGVAGKPSIVVDLGDQEARFYKGGALVGVSPVSTGREGCNTPAGRFRVLQKDADHLSNLYGDYVDPAGNVVLANVGVREDPRPAGSRFRGAPMPFFMRVHGGVGLHGGYLPGYPASHGCIRMPMEMAEIFFANTPSGTPVTIVP